MAPKKPKTDEKTRERIQRHREKKRREGQKAISLTVPVRHERDLRDLATALRAGRNDAPWPSPERVQQLEEQVAELQEARDQAAQERDRALERAGKLEADRDAAQEDARKAREKAQESYKQAQKAANRAKDAEAAQTAAEKAQKALEDRLEGDGLRQWLARRLIGHHRG